MAITREDLPLKFDRLVRPWSYSISHRELILRGGGPGTPDDNVDLVFLDVLAMKLRMRFQPLTISDGTDRADLKEFTDIPERYDGRFLRLLLSDGVHEGFVVCGALRVRPSAAKPS